MKKNSCISVVWECKKCSIKRSSNHNYIQYEVKVSESNLKSFVLEVLDYYENNVIGCTYCKNDVTLSCSLHDNYLAIDFEHQNIKIDLHQVQVTFIKNAKTYFLCGAVEVFCNENTGNNDYKAYCRDVSGYWSQRCSGYKPFRSMSKKKFPINLAMLIYVVA